MKHPLLPDTMTPEALATWIQERSIEKYTEDKKEYYTPEDIQEFEHKVADKSREIMRLQKLKKDLDESLKKGSEGYNVDVPETIGITMLQKGRDHLSENIERGYSLETRVVYGLIYDEEETMEFFDIEGNHIPERTRKLSQREVHEHLGMLAPSYRRASGE